MSISDYVYYKVNILYNYLMNNFIYVVRYKQNMVSVKGRYEYCQKLIIYILVHYRPQRQGNDSRSGGFSLFFKHESWQYYSFVHFYLQKNCGYFVP